MTVYELNRAHLDELRWQMYCDPEQYGEFEWPHDITDEMIFSAFVGIDFVPDDFACNMEV